MPKKSRRYKPKRKGGRRFRGKRYQKKSSELLTYMPIGAVARVLPTRYRTRMTMGFAEYITAGAMIAGGNIPYGTVRNVKGNSCRQPFNIGTHQYFNLASNFALATQPQGFNTLLGANIYQGFRVFASKIEFDLLPQSIADAYQVTIFPSSNLQNNWSLAVANDTQYSSTYVHNAYDTRPKSGYRQKNYLTTHRMYGIDKRSVEIDQSGVYNSAFNGDPLSMWYWNIVIQSYDATANGGNIEVSYRVTYYVELGNLSSPGLP